MFVARFRELKNLFYILPFLESPWWDCSAHLFSWAFTVVYLSWHLHLKDVILCDFLLNWFSMTVPIIASKTQIYISQTVSSPIKHHLCVVCDFYRTPLYTQIQWTVQKKKSAACMGVQIQIHKPYELYTGFCVGRRDWVW